MKSKPSFNKPLTATQGRARARGCWLTTPTDEHDSQRRMRRDTASRRQQFTAFLLHPRRLNTNHWPSSPSIFLHTNLQTHPQQLHTFQLSSSAKKPTTSMCIWRIEYFGWRKLPPTKE